MNVPGYEDKSVESEVFRVLRVLIKEEWEDRPREEREDSEDGGRVGRTGETIYDWQVATSVKYQLSDGNRHKTLKPQGGGKEEGPEILVFYNLDL